MKAGHAASDEDLPIADRTGQIRHVFDWAEITRHVLQGPPRRR
jgi:hypothetical protein